MAQTRRFYQVDVFSTDPTLGNGLAVVRDAEGLTTEQMQRFAAWTNLAETTFILPPEDDVADYKLRIFTPGREMKFAGHPTLGSCAAWLASGGAARCAGVVVQDCAIGHVEIDQTGAVPGFVAPPTSAAPMPQADRDRYARALELDPDLITNAVVLDNGPVWNLLELTSAEAALAVDATRVTWPEFQGLSLLGAYPDGHDFAYESRNIAPSSGMLEDPITGSLNAAIARWLQAEGRLTRDLTISQGTNMGRTGRVHVRVEGDRVLVGGHSNILIAGTVRL
ncbi:Phenazine biosynthesis protein PhzF like [Candidatus Rhodobacter oscarellae]|uniref:Phenazine biosynthesis protein PhzF like n=1 Tax=Candidatus Rhodobacter oscarellae TaxID=1675527 RepID=A0A0J9EAN3_9RHOB|nr:PhzF family phenazine biosynthesis protein [Candidatus Rhodobacter lobularis]KMW59847.1 Phenazine biosynthesis protein PhzF like [Candidatus Rhodobacter lobularis]